MIFTISNNYIYGLSRYGKNYAQSQRVLTTVHVETILTTILPHNIPLYEKLYRHNPNCFLFLRQQMTHFFKYEYLKDVFLRPLYICMGKLDSHHAKYHSVCGRRVGHVHSHGYVFFSGGHPVRELNNYCRWFRKCGATPPSLIVS